MGSEYFFWNIILSVILFTLGILGVLIQRNALSVFMGIELMLNAANLAIINFAQRYGDAGGGAIVLFVITVAAAEAAIGLAIFIRLYRQTATIELDKSTELKG
jgi:NADH-quinone oxidoreductase subunit K